MNDHDDHNIGIFFKYTRIPTIIDIIADFWKKTSTK